MQSKPTNAPEGLNIKNRIPRLILVDGYNLMHFFKGMDPTVKDDRMCPIIFLPFILSMYENGFAVRIVMKTMPKENEVSHPYILKELEDEQLLIYSRKIEIEADDRLMLDLAKKHGAKIISRDLFRNHTGYEKVVQECCIEYDKTNRQFSPERLKETFCFKYLVELWEDFNYLFAYESDPDYEVVKQSRKEFPLCSFSCLDKLDVINLYLYNSFRYVYCMPVSKQVDFLEPFDYFPMSWAQFKEAWTDFEKKRRKDILAGTMKKKEGLEFSDIHIAMEDCYLDEEAEE